MQALLIRVAGNSVICVPPSVTYMTTYILLEQEDWFEKEIGLVRRVLKPGMRAIDIGANYGVYSLAMGRAVGRTGKVWAFEPASTTGRFLRETLEKNGFEQVCLSLLALSDHSGVGRLGTSRDSELNSLSATNAGTYEEVRLAKLDDLADTLGMSAVDFVKLDAEGEEVRILAGGHRFFTEQDPLVMFEVKHLTTVNLTLADAFRALGYDLYRLVGPAQYLIPFDSRESLDTYELNLFACKGGRAARLAQEGFLLLQTTPEIDRARPGAGLELWRTQAFAAAWGATPAVDSEVSAALDDFACWHDRNEPLPQRYAALVAAVTALERRVTVAPTFTCLSTLARLAHEAGRRDLAVQALGQMLNLVVSGGARLSEPCWPAAARYDTVPVAAGDVITWLIAAAVEAYTKLNSFSAYYSSGPTTLAILDWLQGTPYANAEMERRRQLQAIRSGRQPHVLPAQLLTAASPEHLNVEFWTQMPCTCDVASDRPSGETVSSSGPA